MVEYSVVLLLYFSNKTLNKTVLTVTCSCHYYVLRTTVRTCKKPCPDLKTTVFFFTFVASYYLRLKSYVRILKG